MTPQITMDAVDSSQIHSIGHDATTNTLAIRFKNRKMGVATSLYHYANVDSELYGQFATAESKGAFFGQSIKPFEDKYPFVKIESTPAVAQEQA